MQGSITALTSKVYDIEDCAAAQEIGRRSQTIARRPIPTSSMMLGRGTPSSPASVVIGSYSSCSLHDSAAVERQGSPAIGVTTRLASAAEFLCKVLGMPNYKFVTIGRPISSASHEQIADYARATIEQVRQLLLNP